MQFNTKTKVYLHTISAFLFSFSAQRSGRSVCVCVRFCLSFFFGLCRCCSYMVHSLLFHCFMSTRRCSAARAYRFRQPKCAGHKTRADSHTSDWANEEWERQQPPTAHKIDLVVNRNTHSLTRTHACENFKVNHAIRRKTQSDVKKKK